ncbi:MAG: ABC transporter ATP-binding protein [Thermanaerothrix sp.]|uniref:ABC transporter ATP-binding protein n=1 Tax=Thermanaerothrix sp. TaxID=2972675 RepID=UPI003C7E27C1
MSLAAPARALIQPGAEEALILLKGVWKVFKMPSGTFEALKNINLSIRAGEFVSVTGKSGSGKSTLVNMITGIDRPTRGEVRVNGTLLNTLSEGALSVWRGHNLGIVFQFFQLLPMLSVLENVMLPMDFCNRYDPAERESRAMDLLKMVGLEKVAHKLPAALSGGQQQCAAIARALANDPPILVADEPTGNLDSRTAAHVMAIFTDLVAHGKTLVMVTHDLSLAQQAHRVLVISDGELIHPAIVATWPRLSHAAMRHLNRHLHDLRLPPGAELPPSRGVLVLEGSLQPGTTRPRPRVRLEPLAAGAWHLFERPEEAGHFRAGPEGAWVLRWDESAWERLRQDAPDVVTALQSHRGGQA